MNVLAAILMVHSLGCFAGKYRLSYVIFVLELYLVPPMSTTLRQSVFYPSLQSPKIYVLTFP